MIATTVADEIIDLYRHHGGSEYAGEKLTQLEHMSQAAELAEMQGYDEEVVLAAFLHDIGHICETAHGDNEMDGYGIKDHEDAGAEFLRRNGFSERLVTLVQSHVEAKRYLTYKYADYYDQLSEASKKTLEYQGGRMSESEAMEYEKQPLFDLIIQMRRWDDDAKLLDKPVPDLVKYRQMIIRHLKEWATHRVAHSFMRDFAGVNKYFSPRIELISKLMSGIQLVVFDMAGTTVRDKGNVGKAFIDAFEENGIGIPYVEVKKVMGWRKIDAVKMLLQKFQGQANEALINKIHEAFIRNMIRHYEEDSTLSPLPHVEETFAALKSRGVKIALNTGFPRSIADTILKRLNWQEGKTIDAVIASDEVPEGRPHPYMINSIMKKLAIGDSRAVAKVGDTEVDVEEGRSAGCGLVVSVTTGAYSRAQLEQYKPDKIIDSLAELSSLIQ